MPSTNREGLKTKLRPKLSHGESDSGHCFITRSNA